MIQKFTERQLFFVNPDAREIDLYQLNEQNIESEELLFDPGLFSPQESTLFRLDKAESNFGLEQLFPDVLKGILIEASTSKASH